MKLVTGGAIASRINHPVGATPQQETQAQKSQKVNREMLHAAGALVGIELTEAQEAMALQKVNENLSDYDTLRKIDIPLDTEPAFAFPPGFPGEKLNTSVKAGSKKRARRIEVPRYGSIEELAFWSASQLAELIRTRQVSSIELTRMYISRLKRYGPKLLCVVTLAEELALKQAAQADREIRQGKPRGPLHGIPVGVKDLFATKGIRTTMLDSRSAPRHWVQ